MLAQLDDLEGVAESRVDWTGVRFLLSLDTDAPPLRVAEAAAEILGEGARILDESETRAAVDAYRKGETWMRAGETLRLSEFEAGVLARRYGGEAAQELGLEADDRQRLIELFEGEFKRAFERTHSGRGIEGVPDEIEAAAERILDASAGFLSPEQRAALADYLRRFREPRVH